ncbi:MAG: hydrogenase maturation protease [Deltaproteobacteria bacterium]|nr:hydrogenase maturation protease [Deltaproteobacteria bacterium]
MTAVLVLCLGNPLRRDDGVGWRVADELERDPPPGAVIRRSELSGLHLLDDMDGFDSVVLLDAVQSGRRPAGSIVEFPMDALPATAGPTTHGIGLPTALRLARAFGAPVPRHIHVVAVEVEDQASMGQGLNDSVARAVPAAVSAVRAAVANVTRCR